MDKAITVGEVVKVVLIGGGIVGIIAILVAFLSAYAKGFDH